MKDKCFKIGTIQAFLDGELRPGESERVVKHLAACDECALLMTEAQEENDLAFAALDGGLNVLVPTERLRTKVFSAIDEIEKEEKVGAWLWLKQTFAFVGDIDLRSPSVAALACTFLFVGTFAFALKFFPKMDLRGVEVANDQLGSVLGEVPDLVPVSGNAEPNVDESAKRKIIVTVVKEPRKRRVRPQKVAYKPVRKERVKKRAVKKPTTKAPVQNVVGEDIYIQTIATLDKNVNLNKDLVFRPKERVQFEKNIAMVNLTIKKLKSEVRKNPNSKAAKELLKASYQNKIDLLNSVSERTELMASMQ